MKLKEEEVHKLVKGDCVEETISRSGEEVDPEEKNGIQEEQKRFQQDLQQRLPLTLSFGF